MNWAREILGDSIDFDRLSFITITIDKNQGEIVATREGDKGSIQQEGVFANSERVQSCFKMMKDIWEGQGDGDKDYY